MAYARGFLETGYTIYETKKVNICYVLRVSEGYTINVINIPR